MGSIVSLTYCVVIGCSIGYIDVVYIIYVNIVFCISCDNSLQEVDSFSNKNHKQRKNYLKPRSIDELYIKDI